MKRFLRAETITDQPTVDFEIGDHVRVEALSTLCDGYISYIGQITNRPEDKAEDTTVISKYGIERIIGSAPTYTVEPTEKTRYQPIRTAVFKRQRYAAVENMKPATLILDLSSPLVTMQRVFADEVPQSHLSVDGPSPNN